MKDLAEKEKIAYRLLSKDLHSDHLSQCYLFTGENSSLKKEMAEAFAAAILAGKKEWLAEDDSFLARIHEQKHFDYYFLSGRETSLKSEMIEDLQKELWKTALEKGSSRKVFVIDNIDNASIKVYNQLLKFIEETPGESTFGILLSDNADTLLPTIRSRCVRVPFRYSALDLSKECYQKDGFDEEEAYFLANAYPHYQKISLDDPCYLAAKDLRDITLEYLLEDVAYIPYYFQHLFFPSLKEEEKTDIREIISLYFSMMFSLCQEALRHKGFLSSEKREIILTFGAEELYHLCEEMLLVSANVEIKLLMDRFAYRLYCLGGKKYVRRN